MCRLDPELAEFGIVVDAFAKVEPSRIRHLFLTHAHYDHTNDLRKKYVDDSSVTLWCHELTWDLARLQHDFLNRVKAKIQPMKYYEWITVCQGVDCCAIPAHHCDGSAMFAFRTSKSMVLFTGDFRFVRDRFLAELSVDRLYLDDTLWDFQETLPSLADTYQAFKKMMSKRNRAFIHTSSLGFEPFLRRWAEETGGKLCIDSSLGKVREGQLKLLLREFVDGSSPFVLTSVMKRPIRPDEEHLWVVPSCRPHALCARRDAGLFFCTHANRAEMERLVTVVAAGEVIRCMHNTHFACASGKSVETV